MTFRRTARAVGRRENARPSDLGRPRVAARRRATPCASQLAVSVTSHGSRRIADLLRAPSRPPAPRRQHYKWNLDRAVDAFFDGSWQNALVDAAEAKALAESGASPPSPPFATTGGVQNLASDDDADDVPSPPGFADRDPRTDDYHYVDDDDLEDQMLAAAVDESADGRRAPPRRAQGGTGTEGAPIMLGDDDDDDLQRAISASMSETAPGAEKRRRADHQRDNRPPPSPAQDLMFGDPFAGGALAGGLSGFGGAGGSGFGGAHARGAARSGGSGGSGRTGTADEELPEGVTAAEREEARMLEAAMLGVPYEGPVPDAGGGGGLGVSGYGLGAAPSAEVAEARLIRSDTDLAYEESLRQDREKEAARAAAGAAARAAEAEAAEKAAAEAAEAARAAAARDALVAAANEALPDEPAAGDDGVVDIAVKLPDGRRVRRRFAKSHPLQSVFDFLVSAEHLAPGTYRLMSQFPRRAFEDHAEGAPTLEQVGLTQKQEALFVDLL